MSDEERLKIKKKNEMRTKDISQMIDEGGLGADKYYDIVKKAPADTKVSKAKKKNDE